MSINIYSLIEKYSEGAHKYLPKDSYEAFQIEYEPLEKIEHEFLDGVAAPEYMRGEEHHWWGRKHSDKTKKLMSEKAKGNKSKTGRTGKLHPLYGKKKSKSPQSKKAMVNGIIYNSCVEAAEANGITKSTFSYWLKTGKAIKI